MKKILSLVCVMALTVALLVPAFAATAGQTGGSATAGQAAESLAQQVASQPGNRDLAQQLCTQIVADKNIYVNSTMMDAMARAISVNNAEMQTINSTDSSWRVMATYPQMAESLTVSDMAVSGNVVALTASFENGVQSDLGTMITVFVKDELDTSKQYMWICDNSQTGYASVAALNNDPNGYKSVISFYAPHFSKYVIAPVGSLGGSTSGAVNTTGSILASTGADMSVAMVGVAAMAIVMVAGSAVVLKKRSLSK